MARPSKFPAKSSPLPSLSPETFTLNSGGKTRVFAHAWAPAHLHPRQFGSPDRRRPACGRWNTGRVHGRSVIEKVGFSWYFLDESIDIGDWILMILGISPIDWGFKDIQRPSGKRTYISYITNWKITMFWLGKLTSFWLGHVQVRKLLVIARGEPTDRVDLIGYRDVYGDIIGDFPLDKQQKWWASTPTGITEIGEFPEWWELDIGW